MIATTLPPVIKNDTPSYMVLSKSSDTNDGAQDHMYGVRIAQSGALSISGSSPAAPVCGHVYGRDPFQILLRSHRDLKTLRYK